MLTLKASNMESGDQAKLSINQPERSGIGQETKTKNVGTNHSDLAWGESSGRRCPSKFRTARASTVL